VSVIFQFNLISSC